MKRITIILALVAAMLPVLAHAQSDGRTVTRVDVGAGNSSQFGGVGGNYDINIPISGLRGNNLSDDVSAGVDFEVDNNPILACSGMDLRDSIKGMFDMSSLADDVKNYLLSLMAKQALSFVYSNPAIAGVLDGLKAFGNARFELAQSSCEAIEGEVSAESRRLRQEAYNTCMEKENNNYKCATETGSYAQGLNTFVNKQETKINNSIHNWTSRINYAGKDFNTRACENLNGYCNNPSGRAQAEQINTATPGVEATPGGAPKITPPALSPAEVQDEANKNARHATAALYGITRVVVSRLYNGDIDAFVKDYRELQKLRGNEISKDIVSSGGAYTARAGRKYLDREGIENKFVLARSKATFETAGNLQNSMQNDPNQDYSSFEVSEHLEMEDGVGTHSANSCHYDGSCFDVNCNGYSGGEEACVREAGRRLPAGCRMNWESRPQGAGYTGTHGHVNCGGLGSGLGGDSTDGPFAGAIAVIREFNSRIDTLVSSSPKSGATGAKSSAFDAGKKRFEDLRDLLKDFPISDKEACYYDLDRKGKKGESADKRDLEDIRNVTEIFSLTTLTNELAAKMKGEKKAKKKDGSAGGESEEPTAENAVTLANSLPAKIQQMNVTIGRLALCYTVTKINILNMAKTQYLKDSDAFDYIEGIAQAVAGQAALGVYRGLLYQLQLSAITAANDPEASPTIKDAFTIAISMIENMIAGIKGTIEGDEEISARLRSLDTYLRNNAAINAAAAAQRERGNSFNAGGGF